MPTYVLMTKLEPGTLRDPRGRRTVSKDWKRRIAKLCPEIRWIAHYSLLGPYDFMDIYEAPDQQTAFSVSLMSREEGALSAESWPAMSYEDYLQVADQVAAVRDD